MTTLEMITATQDGVQSINSSVRDDFTNAEIVRYLNIAQIEFIKDRYQGINEPGFEEDTKRLSDIQELVTTDFLVPVFEANDLQLGSQYEYLFPYPDDYMFHVTMELGLTRTANPQITAKSYIPCKVITHAEIPYARYITGIHQPYLRNPRVLVREGFFHVFCDAETIAEDGRLIFIRLPDTLTYDETDNSLSVNCELQPHTHTDIVNIAVKLMIGDITDNPSPRIQLESEQV